MLILRNFLLEFSLGCRRPRKWVNRLFFSGSGVSRRTTIFKLQHSTASITTYSRNASDTHNQNFKVTKKNRLQLKHQPAIHSAACL